MCGCSHSGQLMVSCPSRCSSHSLAHGWWRRIGVAVVVGELSTAAAVETDDCDEEEETAAAAVEAEAETKAGDIQSKKETRRRWRRRWPHIWWMFGFGWVGSTHFVLLLFLISLRTSIYTLQSIGCPEVDRQWFAAWSCVFYSLLQYPSVVLLLLLMLMSDDCSFSLTNFGTWWSWS